MSLQLLSSRGVSRACSQLLNAPGVLVYGAHARSRWSCGHEAWQSSGLEGPLLARTGASRYASTPFEDSRGPRDRQRGQNRWSQRPPSHSSGLRRPRTLQEGEQPDWRDKKKERDSWRAASSIILEKGPYSMVKEDVLDVCARHDIFISPDQVRPIYRRDQGQVLARTGWRLILPSPELRTRAFRILDTKVGPHKVTGRPDYDESHKSTSLPLRLAEESKGRYLLVTNIPYSCTKNNVQQLFRANKLMDYSLVNSTTTVQFFDYTVQASGRDHSQDGSERGRRRPGAENSPWDRETRSWERHAERNPNHRRAAVVLFATPEDAFLAWRLRHDQPHTFATEGAPRLLKCRVLE